MSAQVAADLRAAAEVLKRDGWTQGKFYDRSTRCRCVTGALNCATARSKRRFDSAWDALIPVIPDPNVIEWNDAPGRTADEVIAALLAAADAAEADGV